MIWEQIKKFMVGLVIGIVIGMVLGIYSYTHLGITISGIANFPTKVNQAVQNATAPKCDPAHFDCTPKQQQ